MNNPCNENQRFAMLDNKPIYVFDEWAADQDPIFRKYFYVDDFIKTKFFNFIRVKDFPIDYF